jgi:hypothetical protein
MPIYYDDNYEIGLAEKRIKKLGLYTGKERETAEEIVRNPEFDHPAILQFESSEYCVCGHIHKAVA